jgi:riboflavin kinase/FMN adenylyltransferase
LKVVTAVDGSLGALAVTIGSFDGVHRGHRALLARLRERAAALGARTAVVTFEPHPREFFRPESAPRLLSTPEEREILLAEQGIDILVRLVFDAKTADTPAEEFVTGTILALGDVRAVVVGYDFRFGRGRAGDFALLERVARTRGVAAEEVGAAAHAGEIVKSTRIREAVAAGDLARAATLLGGPYLVSGEVVRGAGRGRSLGVSTANVATSDARKLLPPDGVYAVRAAVRGAASREGARAVANLGTRPTFGGGERVLEVHVLDGEHALYGATLSVAFLERLRDERRFESQEALVAQIARDVARAKEIFDREAGASGARR